MAEKVKISIGKLGQPSSEEAPVPEQEAGGEFNHDEHMQKMLEGLKAISEAANMNDMNTVKSISASLLGEETKEKQVEGEGMGQEHSSEMMNKLKGMMQ